MKHCADCGCEIQHASDLCPVCEFLDILDRSQVQYLVKYEKWLEWKRTVRSEGGC